MNHLESLLLSLPSNTSFPYLFSHLPTTSHLSAHLHNPLTCTLSPPTYLNLSIQNSQLHLQQILSRFATGVPPMPAPPKSTASSNHNYPAKPPHLVILKTSLLVVDAWVPGDGLWKKVFEEVCCFGEEADKLVVAASEDKGWERRCKVVCRSLSLGEGACGDDLGLSEGEDVPERSTLDETSIL